MTFVFEAWVLVYHMSFIVLWFSTVCCGACWVRANPEVRLRRASLDIIKEAGGGVGGRGGQGERIDASDFVGVNPVFFCGVFSCVICFWLGLTLFPAVHESFRIERSPFWCCCVHSHFSRVLEGG